MKRSKCIKNKNLTIINDSNTIINGDNLYICSLKQLYS